MQSLNSMIFNNAIVLELESQLKHHYVGYLKWYWIVILYIHNMLSWFLIFTVIPPLKLLSVNFFRHLFSFAFGHSNNFLMNFDCSATNKTGEELFYVCFTFCNFHVILNHLLISFIFNMLWIQKRKDIFYEDFPVKHVGRSC